ncbi:hypothetical protein B0H14DRAFT_2578475 [Mycena olivaceomarginata]|nr:hypothetical protein B0H14DRAFT_2578475 [Mycena olivaceomarginata]
MRFLAHAHLAVLGLLSLGITAYAQQCTTNRGCGPNLCCDSRRELVDLSRSRGPSVDVGARRASCAKKPYVYQRRRFRGMGTTPENRKRVRRNDRLGVFRRPGFEPNSIVNNTTQCENRHMWGGIG